MKTISKLISIVLAISLLGANVISAKENTSISIDNKIKEGKVIEVIEKQSSKYDELETIEVINDDMIDKFAEVAEVLIEEKDNGSKQYTFKEKEPSKKVIYDNGLKEISYRVISLLTIPTENSESANSNDRLLLASLPTYNESKSRELSNTDVLIRAELFYKTYEIEESGVTVLGSKITKGTAQIVKNYERYGRNLRFYMKCNGMRLDSNGISRGLGEEISSTYLKSSPTIGAVYAGSPSFTYFYEVSASGLLALYVSYEVSHNGSTYYTYSLSVTEGSTW